jgi:hypothetical protein
MIKPQTILVAGFPIPFEEWVKVVFHHYPSASLEEDNYGMVIAHDETYTSLSVGAYALTENGPGFARGTGWVRDR